MNKNNKIMTANHEPPVTSYKPVIGLEVHVELKTKSKMFCGCSADYFGQKPNTHTCPVCLGLPGALPVPNKKAIEWCIMIGQALNCAIANFSKFDRKNYFYPDLPKGYQISQYDKPFCQKGFIVLSNGKKIGITRVHMEEDTAKLQHVAGSTWEMERDNLRATSHEPRASLIDFNRSGVPLVEIVTEPDFETSQEVVEYLKKLQQIVRYLGVSKADMEEGNMRLEPNISLRKCNTTNTKNTTNNPIKLPKYKVEVKNINSFRFVEKAIEYEIKRQSEILNEGKTPVQETRGWDEDRQKTVSQRVKEEANDYRYFPEPDIPPIRLSESQISLLKSQMPELPDAKFARFVKQYNLSAYDAEILTREKELTDYLDEAVKAGKPLRINPKQIANVIINKKIDIKKTLPAELIKMIASAKQTTSLNPEALEKIVNNVVSVNEKAVEDYKKGKTNVIMFLIGQVLRTAKQKLDTSVIRNILIKKLK